MRNNETRKNEHIVVTYGLTLQEAEAVKKSISSKDTTIEDYTGCITDVIACSYIAIVINPDNIEIEDLEILSSFYKEINGSYTEKIIFTKNNPKLSHFDNSLQFTVFGSFIEYEDRLKYLILDGKKAKKKSETYSETVSQIIRVLSEIRKHPGITTAELSEITERHPRTVQRYIKTLMCAGELIDYDRIQKGWYIYENNSVLWGDY